MVLPYLLSMLTACDPHDAEVSGDYAIYFGAATSDNLERLRLQYDPPACEYEQSDPALPTEDEAKDGEEFIDPEGIFSDDCYEQRVAIEKEFQADWDLLPVDCRNLYSGSSSNPDLNPIELRASIIPGFEEDFEDLCCAEALDDDEDNDPDGDMLTTNDCTIIEPKYNTWLNDYAFYLHRGTINSWREEVLYTNEGDLQFTFHTQTPFGDFRVFWVIDPDFQPTECTDVDGESTLQEVDGDWVEGWSNTEEDDEGYTVFMVNAYAYQYSPADLDYWGFDEDWAAGYSGGKFGDEDLYGYAPDYIDYDQDAGKIVPLWVSTDDDGKVQGGYGSAGGEQYEELNCGDDFDPDDNCNRYADYADFNDMLRDNAINGGVTKDGDDVAPLETEFERLGRLPHDEFPWHLKVEDNGWRETLPGEGGEADGLDNWAAISPVYVRFKIDRDKLAAIEPGSLDVPIEGDFQLISSSTSSSNSQALIRASFKITNVQRDIWGYSPTLDTQKREENATPECGE